MDVGFLVQFADCGRGYLIALQNLRDVLYAAHGDPSQVHLDERLRHTSLLRRYRSMMAVSRVTPFRQGTFRITSPDVVVRFLL